MNSSFGLRWFCNSYLVYNNAEDLHLLCFIIYLFIYLFVCLFFYFFIFLFIYYLFFYFFIIIYLFIYIIYLFISFIYLLISFNLFAKLYLILAINVKEIVCQKSLYKTPISRKSLTDVNLVMKFIYLLFFLFL